MPEKKGKKTGAKKKMEEPLDSPPEPREEDFTESQENKPPKSQDMEPPEEGDLGIGADTDFEQKPVEGEILDEKSDEHLGGHLEPPSHRADFKSDFADMLEQLGLDVQTLKKFIAVGIVILIVLVFLIWGAGRLFRDRPDDVPTDVPVDPAIHSVMSSYIFGLEYTVDGAMDFTDIRPIGAFAELSSIETALIVGDIVTERDERIIYYIDLLRRMQNIYVTDVYALMDVSLDRRNALDRHISELDDLIQKGVSAVEEIDRTMEELSVEYSEVAAQRDMYEQAFFRDLEDLYGIRVQDNLKSFVEFAQKADRLRAEHNAHATIRKMIVNSVNALHPRHIAVEANADALIKGVRVYEVPGADIDAIIRLD